MLTRLKIRGVLRVTAQVGGIVRGRRGHAPLLSPVILRIRALLRHGIRVLTCPEGVSCVRDRIRRLTGPEGVSIGRDRTLRRLGQPRAVYSMVLAEVARRERRTRTHGAAEQQRQERGRTSDEVRAPGTRRLDRGPARPTDLRPTLLAEERVGKVIELKGRRLPTSSARSAPVARPSPAGHRPPQPLDDACLDSVQIVQRHRRGLQSSRNLTSQ